MSWTTPRTWTTGEFPSAATMNTHVRDNFNAVWHNVTQVTGGADASLTTAVLDLIDAPAATFAAVLTKLQWSIGGIDDTGGHQFEVYLYKNGVNIATLGNAALGSGGSGGIAGFYMFTAGVGTDTYSLRTQLGFGSCTIYAPYTICLDQQGS